MNLTSLEKAVLETMLEKPSEYSEAIKQQLAAVIVARRELTGVGFFTNFIVPTDVTVRRDLPNMELTGVVAEFPNLEHGAGFVLFIRDGVVRMLEGYTFDENWPNKTDEFKLSRTKAA
jgi:hypothetical protein